VKFGAASLHQISLRKSGFRKSRWSERHVSLKGVNKLLLPTHAYNFADLDKTRYSTRPE
jgi:hypothetical protein